MTQLSNEAPAVLRRRVRTILKANLFIAGEPIDEAYLMPILKAADEIEARRRYDIEGEQVAVDAIADNIYLRASLKDVLEIMSLWPVPPARSEYQRDKIRRAIDRVTPPGDGRMILATEIRPETTRAEVEAAVASALDAYYAEGADHRGKVTIEVERKPEGAEDHGAQRGAPEEADREAGRAGE